MSSPKKQRVADLTVPGIPALNWLNDAYTGDASFADGVLRMVCPPKCDWFNDPASPTRLSSAPVLVFPAPASDWQLSAKATVAHKSLFDAAVLFVHQTNDDYAKLCFEFSPEKEGTIVSVITRDTSDDCNGTKVEGDTVNMRVSKYGDVLAFHYKWIADGSMWRLHRIFRLRDPKAEMSIGFLSQAPTGDPHTSLFSDIEFTETTLKDPRDGS